MNDGTMNDGTTNDGTTNDGTTNDGPPSPPPLPSSWPTAGGQSAPATPPYEAAPPYVAPTPPPPTGSYGAGPVYGAPTPAKGNGKAVAALVLGILALLGCLIPFVNIGSIILGALAIVFGSLGLRDARRGSGGRGLGITGIVTGAVAVVVSIVVLTVSVAAINSIDDETLDQIVDDAMSAPAAEPSAPADDASAQAPADEPADTGAEAGTRDNPLPAGQPFGNDLITVQLGEPTWDATQLIAAENQFNEAAPEGSTYVLLPVTVTNVASPDAITPWLELDVSFVSDDGRSFDSAAVVTPSDLTDVSELYEGGVGTGNLVFAIPVEAQSGGAWAVSFQWSDPVFVAAH